MAQAMDAVPEHFAQGWLHDAARTELGLADFGADYYAESLDRLCASINDDADLNPYGRLIMAMALKGALVNRLVMAQLRGRSPEKLSGPTPAPIIVTGLPRTGTTFLHRLLAADTAHASLPLWQLNRPIPREPDDTPEARIKAIDDLIGLRRQITPELDAVHLVRPNAPEECMWMAAPSMFSRLYYNMAPVHGWLRWYVRAEKTGRYAEYRDLLTYLSADYPSKRLVLKSPDHLDGIVELMEALPDARVICTHRDMGEQFASYMSLGRATKTIATNHLDSAAEAAAVTDMFDQSIAHMDAARARFGDRLIDVAYSDLMADPLASVSRIYEFAGLRLPDARRAALAEHHAQNPKGKHGKHDYSLDEFGVSEAWLRTHYADYAARFPG